MKKEIIEIDGLPVQFYISGNSNSEKGVLFVHGFALSGLIFKKQLESELLSQYQLISFDLPGCGNTPFHERVHSLNYLVKLIKLIIESSDIKNYVLVGHSLGGHISTAAIALCNNISGLFTIGAPPLRNLEDFGRAFIPSPISMLYKDSLLPNEITVIVEQLCVKNKNRKELTEIVNLSTGLARKKLFDSFADYTVNEVNILKTYEDLPVFLWHSINDNRISLEYLNFINSLLPESRQIIFIENDSHTPMIDYSKSFNMYLADFLNKTLR